MQSEYTQDVTFNSDFGALQTPVHITTALALSGWQPSDISGHFRYLDLACGNGHTLSLLAESHPHAEFVGIDINAEHVTHAQRWRWTRVSPMLPICVQTYWRCRHLTSSLLIIAQSAGYIRG